MLEDYKQPLLFTNIAQLRAESVKLVKNKWRRKLLRQLEHFTSS